ncbi:hypothetical protein Nepgr_009378 [Nepenthes gracilis]|uniref:Uncharacterized protein n=1 Tax=Nepenthes gracilis TaxID=150966 RepID=A0AAD3SAH7_NEPGR|nr:hypothetical protein Nepgr_009378 [Nepenthes gracilis]
MLVSGTFDIAGLMECDAIAHGCYLAALDHSGCCVGCYFCRSGSCWMMWLPVALAVASVPCILWFPMLEVEDIFDDILALKLNGELAWAAVLFAEGGSRSCPEVGCWSPWLRSRCAIESDVELGPPALGSSVQTSPQEHSPVKLDSCMVKVPLSPLGTPRIPELPGESCSENNLATPSLKDVNGCLSSVSGLESPGNPDIPYRALTSQLRVDCTPVSVDTGLDLHLTADSPRSEPDNSMILVDAALPAGVVPRTASCPALMQQCTQKSHLPIGPSYAEILCCGTGDDPTGSLVGGEACWPISVDDRKAALGLVDAPLDPVLEPPIGLDSYPPGPPDPEVDLLKTPPSISRVWVMARVVQIVFMDVGTLLAILMVELRLMVLALSCCWDPELQRLVADYFSANAVMSCCLVFDDDGAG